jgi:D,D-heptose 1,7-bisphosphate phosphatase
MKIDQAVILCGGLGSRLGDLTRDTPKPLLPVGDTPFLQLLIQEITRYGVDRFVLLAAFRSEQIQFFADTVAERIGRDIEVTVSIEPDRAGTGGALFHARDQLDEVFYLFNGDSILDTPLDAVADLMDRPDAQCAIALRHLPEAGRYGVCDLEGDRIVTFGRKADPAEPAWINGGVYVMRRALIDQLAPQSSLEEDLLTKVAKAGQMYGLRIDGFFLDIGVPEDFARAQSAVPEFRTRPAIFFDRDGVLNLDHGHVGTVERFEWVEGAREAVALANARGFYAFLITNQAGIAKGHYDLEDYGVLYRHIQLELGKAGARLDDARFCPDHPDAVDPRYRRVSDWRKPAPGMLLDLMDKWPIDRAASFVIGDNETDMAAAKAAGVDGYLFAGGRLDQFLDDILENRSRA